MWVLFDLRFLMQCVLAVELTILPELKLSLGIPSVFLGSIVPATALFAFQRNLLHCTFLLACHTRKLLTSPQG